ncbi:MAG TPA: PEP/pyruvate-binding domain-containing protein, partial [Acidimicrobiia bacterium]|nr:PEP/pyruvate-binding domain-containing protein [Acidimicrobiia bacterium]
MALAHHPEETAPAATSASVSQLPAPSSRRGLVLPLDGRGHHTALVGGKASALDALVRLGYRVPPAYAVTTAAYVRFVTSAPGLQSLLSDLASSEIPPPELADAAARAVDDAFLATPLPASVDDELMEAAERLVAGDGGGHELAVRSSATSEDLADLSFAGQHRSLLGVGDPEGVR